MENQQLISEIQSLYFKEDRRKLNHICELLDSTSEELRGKINPELQLSASALVFQKEKMYFIEHPYQKELLLPAGHVELDEEPLETAIREFHEETGFFAMNEGKLVDVNLISIPFNEKKQEQAHLHIDFRYLLTLSSSKNTNAELPVFLLDEKEAPQEFKKYYQYLVKE